jgi:hypothetical protein
VLIEMADPKFALGGIASPAAAHSRAEAEAGDGEACDGHKQEQWHRD